MYELGFPVGNFANLCFGLTGIFMAHALYTTPRPKWQAVLVWALIYPAWGFGAEIIQYLFPTLTYERASMLIGLTGIFVFILLFPNIAKIQSIFSYFMISTAMNLIVLFARMVSVFFAPYVSITPNMLFLVIYITVLVGFAIVFYCFLRDYILQGLKVFQGHLTVITVFSAVGYVTLLLLADPWSAWEPLDIWEAMKWLGVIAFVILGYVMAFRILVGINNQNHAKMEARKLSEQLILSEQYYDTLVKQVEKIRAYNHDLRYHVETLSGLCAAQDWKGVCEYVESMSCELPKSLPKQYCPVGAANALLQYYAGLCSAEDIEFRCQVYIPQDTQIQPLHLCIILGNGLCNALEAVQKLPKDAQRYIALRVMTEGGKLAISIENPCPTEPQPDQNGGYRTTKRESGHGLGMGNIWEAARHYNGWCKSDWANGIFTLRVMLTEKMAV